MQLLFYFGVLAPRLVGFSILVIVRSGSRTIAKPHAILPVAEMDRYRKGLRVLELPTLASNIEAGVFKYNHHFLNLARVYGPSQN